MSGMYWYAVAASDDVAGLKNKGFCVTSDGEILYNEQYEYALARMYTSDGHGIVDVETSNFFFDKDASDRITINAEDPMTTPVLSYKLRMTDQYPDAEWFYFAADKSEEILEDGVPHPLYKSDGTLATKTDYADCEFEALNPMPSEEVGMYGRFTTATFSFTTYQSTADVLHVEFTGLHQEEAEYCFADRLRVVVTASPMYGIPMGGMMSPTGHSTYYMQELPEQIIVDNITLSGRMIPSSSLEEYFGNDQLEPESITINNDDVIIPLYDFDVPVTDQSKLYGVKSIAGTGSGSVPVTVTADGFPTSAGDTNENMKFRSYGGYLYDSIGNKIYVGNNATVISAKVFLKNGNDVTYQLSSLFIYNGYLHLLWNTNYTWVEAYKITYTVDMVQSFNDLDTLRQMGLVSLIYNGNHQLCLKFSCAGTGITFTGSMDSVVVITAIKQQMTVDNIGLQGIVGPMGGMMVKDYDYDKSWVSASKSQETVSTSMRQYLYDDNGNFIVADDSKTYTIISVDGNTSSDILSKLAIVNTHIATPERLGIEAHNNTYWEIQMTYVEYTIS